MIADPWLRIYETTVTLQVQRMLYHQKQKADHYPPNQRENTNPQNR